MAIAEILAIASTINAAAGAINKVAGTCNDLNTIGSFVGKLGQAQVDLQTYQNKRKGSLSQEELIQIALAKKAYNDKMNEIRELFIYSGNAQLWDEIQTEMANARKRRIAEIKAKAAARKKAIKYTAYGFLGLLVCVATYLGLIIAIKTYATELEPWKHTIHGIVYSYGIL